MCRLNVTWSALLRCGRSSRRRFRDGACFLCGVGDVLVLVLQLRVVQRGGGCGGGGCGVCGWCW